MMMVETLLEQIDVELPCRRQQLREILNFIGEADEPAPPCLFLYGSTATGKTACTAAVLKLLNYKRVFVNAAECYSQKILYEIVLNTLSGHSYTPENKFAPLYKCDNMKDFIARLNEIHSDCDYAPVTIVVDNAERLRSLGHNVLPVLLRLKEFCTFNVCTILISNVIFEKFYLKTGLKEPVKIFFPQYTKEEFYKIMMLDQSECVNYISRKFPLSTAIRDDLSRTDVFANFLNAFLSVFYRSCRDLVELKYMSRANYAKYCEPIIKDGVKADDVTRLWRNISPTLKSSLETLYLRINTSKTGIENKMANLEISNELTSVKTYAQSFELPFYAKYLLIAAYLASFNPPKEDKRLFMKNHGKQRKRLQQVNAEAKLSERLSTQLGPKQFTLDRLLAIFFAIIEERISLTTNLLVQISSLVNLRLLTTSSDSTKYKCTVSYEFISTVSRMVGFNIKKYLYDFI